MPDFYLKSGSGVAQRANSTAYSTGNCIVPARADTAGNAAVAKRWVWECTTAGTSGGAVPTWPASVTQDVTTVTDGTVTWTARKPGFSSGSTANWSFATIYMDYAASAMAAGDRLFVSSAHAESVASALTITFPGTLASPCLILCANDAAAPPTALADTASVTTTGANGISVVGTHFMYGVNFVAGNSNSSGITIALSTNNFGGTQTYRECSFNVTNGNAGSRIYVGSNNSQAGRLVRWENCDVGLSEYRQFIQLGGATLRWSGGAMLAGSSTPTGRGLIGCYDNGRFGAADVEGVNLSGFAAGLLLIDQQEVIDVAYRNCRLPTSWVGSLVSATPAVTAARAVMHNCDSGNTNYRINTSAYTGSVLSETSIVRTGGASDGSTALSWKLVSTSNAEYPHLPLESPEIVRWNDTTGSSITVTVETVTDNVTLTDAECWIEVQYLGTSGLPLSTFISDAKADVLATAANQTSSSATWTTTGLTTPVKQSLSVSFTPQEAGYIHAVVKLAKASTTVYVDPLLTVT